MNSWVIIFLGGTNGTNVVIKGSFADLASAEAAIVSTGSPWNYQPCQVWGPAVPPPMGTLSPIAVSVGAWLAIASGITPSGGVRPIGYGTFASEDCASSWAASQGNPAGYSFGQIASL